MALELNSHEATKRVLYHVVHAYQSWRNESLGVPNEFTDDAIRIGEQHLREVDWFPESEGWLARGDYEIDKPDPDVLGRIEAELDRLQEDQGKPVSLDRWWNYKRGWQHGVRDARDVAYRELQKIRDAYVTELLTRETETTRAFGITEQGEDK